jgi:NAD(P)-dependent dehydrogenase (short-subunit alcohol dehydrogenase family)
MSLEGAVAIVTGASRGIGKGCAIELGAAGATVYITGRTHEPGGAPLPGTVGETAQAVDEAGGRGIPVVCDHLDDGAVASLFERVGKEHGQLDVLVNSAYLIPREMMSGRPFWEVPISNWDDCVNVGTRGAYVASHFAARLMVPRRRGLIANISSSGAEGYAWSVGYGVGKAALDRLTADTAHELRPHGVSVVSLWPGLVLTERVAGNRANLKGLENVHAESQRFTGRAVVALAQDPDALRHTGQALPSRDLADLYGFVDIDGSLPDGPLSKRPSQAGG